DSRTKSPSSPKTEPKRSESVCGSIERTRTPYDRGSYSQVLKALTKVVEGTPQVQTYEVVNSTFHKHRTGRKSLKRTDPFHSVEGGRIHPLYRPLG
ncbi:MAG TPA: hypothetical protein VIX19_10060, partial [Terriglobales bacterium]